MTANVLDLEKALRSGVMLANLGRPIAQPNASFEKPAEGVAWVAFDLGFDQPRPMGTSTGHSGVITLTLNYPLLTGTSTASAWSRQVVGFFRAGRVLSHGETRALVESSWASSDGEREGYATRDVKVSWAARIPRRA